MCCRWVKFEEDVEEGGERWSKPHVASLALSSLQQLRAIIESDKTIIELFVETNSIEELVGTRSLLSFVDAYITRSYRVFR